MHIKDEKNGKQVNFSFSKIWWASKVSLLAIENDCVARSCRFSVPLTCTRAIIRQKVYCEGRNEKCEFSARESVSSLPIVRIFGKGKCKFTANFSATMVTSLPSISLSFSVSLSLSLSHQKYLTHNIGSAEALPILCVRYFRWERERERYRETERDGSDVTTVALKLALNLHFPCQKIAQLAMSLHFPLPNSHFSFLPSHFPSLPSRSSPLWRWNSQWVHTFHGQKFERPLCTPSFKWHEPRDEWSKPNRAQDQILPSPILFFPSKNWIKLIPKTIGNRKRDCAWGGS